MSDLPHSGSPTSRAAAESMRNHVATLRETVWRSIADVANLGRTCEEIQNVLGLDGNTVRPRLRELEKQKRVRVTDETRPTSSGRQAQVYVVTAEAGVEPQPFLKWIGGKRSIYAHIQRLLPPKIGNYHEPFVGGGAVYFGFFTHLGPHVYLSDLNPHLITTYQAVRDNVEDVIAKLGKLAVVHNQENYYVARERFNSGNLSPVQLAAHMIYLNKTCFNGLYRVNKDGKFNAAFGRYKDPAIVQHEVLRAASAALSEVSLACCSYERAFEVVQPGDFVYCDPPYDPVSETADFTGYHEAGFGRQQQIELADRARQLSARGVMVLLSNHDTELVRSLYSGWGFREIEVRRKVNCDPSKRKNLVGELLIYNYVV